MSRVSGWWDGYDPAMTAPTNTTHYILTQNTAEPLRIDPSSRRLYSFRDHVVDFYNQSEAPPEPTHTKADIIPATETRRGSEMEWDCGEHPHGRYCRADCLINWKKHQLSTGGTHYDCMWCQGCGGHEFEPCPITCPKEKADLAEDVSQAQRKKRIWRDDFSNDGWEFIKSCRVECDYTDVYAGDILVDSTSLDTPLAMDFYKVWRKVQRPTQNWRVYECDLFGNRHNTSEFHTPGWMPIPANEGRYMKLDRGKLNAIWI